MSASQRIPAYVLPCIVLAQLAGTSVWFAGNAIVPAMQAAYHLPDHLTSSMTIAVQLGFITGTLVFALLMLADRLSPVKLFMLSALLAATCNLALIWSAGDMSAMLLVRGLTGFFLAGVYPVGMKIAADWFAAKLGKALGFLVGALVLGTALPHWVKSINSLLDWQVVIIITTLCAAVGGLIIGLCLRDGPHRTKGQGLQIHTLGKLFSHPPFRAAAFGYFGHMWELYTFWAFVPLFIQAYNALHQTTIPVARWSFYIIGAGAISSTLGGYLSARLGSARVAALALLGSGICCVLMPWFFFQSPFVFLSALVIWGMLVIADSPQFSALVSQTSVPQQKGTALTLVTCIGFAITIVSIQSFGMVWRNLSQLVPHTYTSLLLLIGPLLGLLSMRRLLQTS